MLSATDARAALARAEQEYLQAARAHLGGTSRDPTMAATRYRLALESYLAASENVLLADRALAARLQ